MSVPAEQPWQVLFDVALSHGRSLAQRKLTFNGFNIMLVSAELVGARSGVYSELVDRLWHKHSSFVDGFSPADDDRGVVGFDSFTDIMNLISVRCFQTKKSNELLKEGKEALQHIISLSAEDKVHLEESVQYTANVYLKQYIFAHTVHKSTTVRLDPLRNHWSSYTNAVITHLVSSYEENVIIPLFAHYAEGGALSKDSYMGLLEDLFPHFSPLQRASAAAIFNYKPFMTLSSWLQCSRLTKTPAADDAAYVEEEEADRLLGLDAFVDMLLMLSVVAYADTRRYPHHRTICSKAWSFFEEYLVPAVCDLSPAADPKTMLAPDPLLTNSYAHLKPELTFAYPQRVPIEMVSTILVGGFFLQIPPEELSETEAAPVLPMRLMDREKIQQLINRRQKAGALLQAGQGDNATEPQVDGMSLALTASKLFTTQFDPSSRAAFQTAHDASMAQLGVVSKKGRRALPACAIYLDTTCVQKHWPCSEHLVEAEIPSALRAIDLYQLAVNFVEASGEEGLSHLVFTPVKRVKVSLRFEGEAAELGKAQYVVLMSSSVQQYLDNFVVDALRDLFGKQRAALEAKRAEERAEKEKRMEEEEEKSDTADDFPADSIPFASLVTVCENVKLLGATANAEAVCRAAAESFFDAQVAAGERADTSLVGALAHERARHAVTKDTPLNFNQFVCLVVEVMLHRTHASSRDIPDVSHVLRVALSSHAKLQVRALPPGAALAAENTPALPYDSALDVPYHRTMKKNERSTQEDVKRKEHLIQLLQASCQARIQTQRPLPPLPGGLKTVPMVSMFDMLNREKQMKDFLKSTSDRLQKDFLRNQIEIDEVNFEKS